MIALKNKQINKTKLYLIAWASIFNTGRDEPRHTGTLHLSRRGATSTIIPVEKQRSFPRA
jgi:hypothetical protein